MNIDQIVETIYELENAPTTFQNCINLSALYTVRDNLLKTKIEDLTIDNNAISTNAEKELSDLFPAYQSYIDKKVKYQQGNMIADNVIDAMRLLCVEIKEFIVLLYASTESKAERRLLESTINTLATKYL